MLTTFAQREQAKEIPSAAKLRARERVVRVLPMIEDHPPRGAQALIKMSRERHRDAPLRKTSCTKPARWLT